MPADAHAPATIDSLGAHELTLILQASQEPGEYMTSASLARANRAMRAGVSHSGAHPLLGRLLSDAELIFPAGGSHLEDGIRSLPLPHRDIALRLLMRRLGALGAGPARTRNFAEMRAACSLLADHERGPALARLSALLPLLPQSAEITDRASQFIDLVEQSTSLSRPHCAQVLTALAGRVQTLNEHHGWRQAAIASLLEKGKFLNGEEQAPLLCNLARASATIDHLQSRAGLFQRLMLHCRTLPPSPQKAQVLVEFARHAGAMGHPPVLELMAQLWNDATGLGPADKARVVTQFTRMLGTVPVAQRGAAAHLITLAIGTLPPTVLDDFHVQVRVHEPLTGADTLGNLLEDAGTISAQPARNNVSMRLQQLPASERAAALHALVQAFDATLPPAFREDRFDALHAAAWTQPMATMAFLMPSLASRLHLLSTQRAFVMATNMVDDSVHVGVRERANIIGALAGQFGAIPLNTQETFSYRLFQHARDLPDPEARASALLAIGGHVWRIESKWTRERLTQELYLSTRTLDPATRIAAMPTLISNLTRFTAGNGLDKYLAEIRDDVLAAGAEDHQVAQVLQALACHAGDCSPATRGSFLGTLQRAADNLPPPLAKAILAVVDRQQAIQCSLDARIA